MTITLPEPKIETPSSPWRGEQGRSRRVIYELGLNDAGKTRAVEISISHYKGHRAALVATAYFTVNETHEGGSTSMLDPMRGVRLRTEPLPRFSKAAIEKFTAEVVGAFPNYVAVSSELQAMLTQQEV